MKIIIDLQGMQTTASSHRGVGRYTENLVRELLIQNDRHEILLAMNGAMPENIDYIKMIYSFYIPEKNFIVWHQTFNTAALSAADPMLIEAGEVLREVFLASYHPDIIFCTNLQEGAHDLAVNSVNRLGLPVIYVTTLHDVVPLFYEETYLANEKSRGWYFGKINSAISSDIIFTDSHSSKREIVEKLKVDPEKIAVATLGYDASMYYPRSEDSETHEVMARYHLSPPYIMYFGGSDSHKNLVRLVKAYAQLSPSLRGSFKLLMAGKDIAENVELVDLVSVLGIAPNVHFCGYISEADLPIIISKSTCFVFPSTHEGFGLPALEAMACGVPVIGSRSSSIQEVIDNPAALFDPFDEIDIAYRLTEVLTNVDKRSSLIASGLKRAGHYSWKDTAATVLNFIDKSSHKIPPKGWGLGNPAEYMIDYLSGRTNTLTDQEILSIAESINGSFPLPRKPRIYIDISSVIIKDHRSGIQRVARGITSELLKLNSSNSSVVYEAIYTTPDDLSFFSAHEYVTKTLGLTIVSKDSFIEFNAGDTLLYLDLHPGVAISHRAYNISLRARGVKVYHVVYDLLPILKPDTFWPEICREFRAWAETVSVSDGALCISNAVAGEFKDFVKAFGELRATPLNIGWFHLGADFENSAPTRGYDNNATGVLKKIKAKTSFLMVGTIEPRKGHKQTLAAFEQLWQDGHDVALVVVGRLGWGMHDFEQLLLTHSQLDKRLFWLAGISDEYLEEIYGSCACLIAASEGEGFGLPLIEAAQHSLPIICRDIPVFKEVAGDNAYYFINKNDPSAIAQTIVDWKNLKQKNNVPKSTEISWLSWAESAQQLVDLLMGKRWSMEVKGEGGIIPDTVLTHRTNRINFNGFSAAEENYRWTSRKEVSLSFKWMHPSAQALLRIKVDTLFHQEQAVEVYFDQTKIYGGVLRGHDAELICAVSDLKQGWNTVSMRLPDARRPSQDPFGDKRILALAVKSVEFLSELAPLPVGVPQDCRSLNLLFQGWFGAEQWFRWSNGNSARIDFWIERDMSASLTLHGRSFREQSVDIYFDDDVMWSGVVDGDDLSITSDLVDMKRGLHHLSFHLPTARKPEGDPRILALAMISLTLNHP